MDELSARTVRIIEEAGRSPSAHQDDIVRTLQATSDPDLARELRRGRLSAALEPVSALSGLTTWFEESGAAEAASNRDRQRGLERAAEEAEAALFAAERDLATTQSELSRLQVQLRDATLQVEQLTRLCDQRRDELAGAHKALADETA
jgi:chromosome segregation ATPase